jgi:MOSC domain-containing protein YiiM
VPEPGDQRLHEFRCSRPIDKDSRLTIGQAENWLVRDGEARLGETVTHFVAQLTRRSPGALPLPAAAGDDWLAVLRQWLARENCGLVSVANPEGFSWPGHWIGIVDMDETGHDPVGVLLFGTPSAVVASPDAPDLIGLAAEDLHFRQALILTPFDPFTQAEVDHARARGKVIGIYITAAKTEPMRSVQTGTAIEGRGLEGDRYAAGAGTFTPRSDRLRGYDITLIESEVLEHLTLADGTHLAPHESRRNLITKGIDLNALVGREFRIGSVRAFGQRLCEPCVHLQRLTHPGVVAALAHRGGLRADLLSAGELHLGDEVLATG